MVSVFVNAFEKVLLCKKAYFMCILSTILKIIHYTHLYILYTFLDFQQDLFRYTYIYICYVEL